MRIDRFEYFVKRGDFSECADMDAIEREILSAVKAVTWHEPDRFVIRPSRTHENGVVPIKANFISHLIKKGWEPEQSISVVDGMSPGRIDAIKKTSKGIFAVEWETGNISSSHRALNKMALGVYQKHLIGGILILPIRNFSKHLTDRIGNYEELAPYFPLFKNLDFEDGLLGVIAIDYDGVDESAPLIPKGADGNAFRVRR